MLCVMYSTVCVMYSATTILVVGKYHGRCHHVTVRHIIVVNREACMYPRTQGKQQWFGLAPHADDEQSNEGKHRQSSLQDNPHLLVSTSTVRLHGWCHERAACWLTISPMVSPPVSSMQANTTSITSNI